MRKHLLPGTDLKVSSLCCGGGSLGTTLRGPAMDRHLDTFRDLGGNFFDTAHGYSSWAPGGTAASELALADYFKRRGKRGLVLATKGGCWPYDGYRRTDQYMTPARITCDIDDSLGRLRVDTIDFYWLHRDDPRLDVGTIIDGLNAEIKRGRIRFLGVSNWTSKRLAAANAYAAKQKLRGFSASQPEWCLAAPNMKIRTGHTHFLDDADIRWHQKTQIPVIAYTPTAGGYFAGPPSRGDGGFDNPVSRARRKRVQSLAAELRCSPNQIALAYLLAHPFPVIPILGTTKLTHLRDAFKALAVTLSHQQREWLRDG